MTERTVIVKPIDIKDGYLYDKNKKLLNGFLNGKIESINMVPSINGIDTDISINNFFIKNRIIYFSFIDKYTDSESVEHEDLKTYSQEGSTIVEINQLPVEPVLPIRITADLPKYEITTYEWENNEYSIIKRKIDNKSISNADAFNSFITFNNGIFFAQKNESVRESGVWYYNDSMRGGPMKVEAYLYIWKIDQ